MSDISVTVSSPEVVLNGRAAAVTASVTNGGASTERVVLGAFPAGGSGSEAAGAADPGWATVERPLREVGPGATEQYALTLSAPSAQAGTYRLKLIAHPAAAAPEEYADRGAVLRLVVPAMQEAPPPPPRRRWWPWAVGAGLLVAVVLVVLVLLLRPGGGPGADPRPVPGVPPVAEEGGIDGGDEETVVPDPARDPVVSQGELTFTPTMALDLDTGAVNPRSGADVEWRLSGDRLVSDPTNGARLSPIGATFETVTRERLRAVQYRSDPLTTRDVAGTVIAFVTDEGRHAAVALDAARIGFQLRWVTFE